MTDSMKWMVICVVAALLFFGVIAFAAHGNAAQRCGSAGIYRTTGSVTQDNLTIICKNGTVIEP